MKAIKYIVVSSLLMGGFLTMVGFADAFYIPGMLIGLVMLYAGAILGNIWEDVAR